MVRHLTPNEFRSMPWKNGGGRTTEIAAYPPGSALDAFLWRVSLADVGRDGPFSLFPGIDRTLVLLEGAGMRLRGRLGDTELTMPFEPHTFSGDAAVECTLVAGPVRDFNAMFRRGRARGSVAVVRERGAEFATAQFRLAYAAIGAQECIGATRWPLRLEAGHALVVDETGAGDGSSFALRPLGAGAVALVVSVDCR
jgi:hypothetical protein